MSDLEHEHGPDCGDPRSMDSLDEYLTVWIFGATAFGVGLGYVAPSVTQLIHLVEIGLHPCRQNRDRRQTDDLLRDASEEVS